MPINIIIIAVIINTILVNSHTIVNINFNGSIKKLSSIGIKQVNTQTNGSKKMFGSLHQVASSSISVNFPGEKPRLVFGKASFTFFMGSFAIGTISFTLSMDSSGGVTFTLPMGHPSSSLPIDFAKRDSSS